MCLPAREPLMADYAPVRAARKSTLSAPTRTEVAQLGDYEIERPLNCSAYAFDRPAGGRIAMLLPTESRGASFGSGGADIHPDHDLALRSEMHFRAISRGRHLERIGAIGSDGPR